MTSWDLTLVAEELRRYARHLGTVENFTQREPLPRLRTDVQLAAEELNLTSATRLAAAERIGINLDAIQRATQEQARQLITRWITPGA